MSNTPLIQVESLHRSLRSADQELHILRGITFTIDPGEWVAITGPSGSGKSTLLGILAGIDRPTQGKVWLDRIEISSLSENKLARVRNEKVGIVFQSFHLIPNLTAQENVEAPLYISPRRRQAHNLAREMLDRVGLAERMHHMPHQLSGGEQQRVAIARALVNNPCVLLADEPTGNLDSATSQQVLSLIRHLHLQLGLTVIMVTHDPKVAANASRKMSVIDGHLNGSARNGGEVLPSEMATTASVPLAR